MMAMSDGGAWDSMCSIVGCDTNGIRSESTFDKIGMVSTMDHDICVSYFIFLFLTIPPVHCPF